MVYISPDITKYRGTIMRFFKRNRPKSPPEIPKPVVDIKTQMLVETVNFQDRAIGLLNELVLQILLSWKPEDEVMSEVVKSIRRAFNADSVWYCQLITDGDQDLAVLKQSDGLSHEALKLGAKFNVDNTLPTLSDRLYENDLIVLHHDDRCADSLLLHTWDLKTMLLIPIGVTDRTYGCLGVVYRGKKQHICANTRTLLRTIGRLVTIYVRYQRDRFINRCKRDTYRYLVGGTTIYTWTKHKDGTYISLDDRWVKRFYPGLYKHLVFLGMDDLTAIQKFRSIPGNSHTYGEICVGSDDITYQLDALVHYWEVGSINNEPLLLHVIKKPLYDDQGRTIGISGLAYDITHLGLESLYQHADLLIQSGSMVAHTDNRSAPVAVFRFIHEHLGRRYQLAWMLNESTLPKIETSIEKD